MDIKLGKIISDLNLETDKDSCHSYAEIYDDLFKDLFDKKINLLEIGFDRGGSAQLWCNAFPNAKILSMDIDISKHTKDALNSFKNFSLKKIDAYSKEAVDSLEEKFDIIIDDGPHTLESFFSLIKLYLPKLKKEGLLLIEDVQSHDWISQIIEKVPFNYEVKVYDLREKKNRYDDILILIKEKEIQ